MNEMKLQDDKYSGLGYLEVYLPFFMLLVQYSIGSIRLGLIGLAIVAALTLYRNNFKIKMHNEYRVFFWFLAYALVTDVLDMIINVSFNQSLINRIIEYLLFYFFTFIVVGDGINEDRLYKAWKIAAIIFSVGLIYHWVLIYVFGQSVSPITIIPNYVLREGIKGTRPLSFFAEPESFVNAVFPALVLALRKNDYKWSVGVTVMLLMSTSTIGVVFSLVAWVSFILTSESMTTKRRVSLLGIIAIGVVAFFNLNIFDATLEKLLNVVNGESTMASRVTNGFSIVSRLDKSSWLFGTTSNDIESYVSSHDLMFSGLTNVYSYLSQNRLFLNTFSQLIFKYGIVGAFLYVNSFLKGWRRGFALSPLLIAFLFGILAQTSLLNSYYFMVVILVLAFRVRDKNDMLCYSGETLS